MEMEKRINRKGALTVPAALRREIGVKAGEKVVLKPLENGNILVERVAGSCIFCGETSGVTAYKGRFVCPACAAELGGKGNV